MKRLRLRDILYFMANGVPPKPKKNNSNLTPTSSEDKNNNLS